MTGDPLDRIARHAEFDRDAGRTNRIVPIDELLALVEVARAAREVDGTTVFTPEWYRARSALRAALARLDGLPPPPRPRIDKPPATERRGI